MDTENLWKVSAYMPPGPCKFVGEDDVLGPGIDSGRGRSPGCGSRHRRPPRPWRLGGLQLHSRAGGARDLLQCFIMPDHTHHYFGGRRLQRSYSLHNNKFTPSNMFSNAVLMDAAGKEVMEQRSAAQMDSGDIQRGEFSFDAPKVDAADEVHAGTQSFGRRQVRLRRSDATSKSGRTPRFRLGKLERQSLLFDPEGTTAAVLKKAGIPFEAISALAARRRRRHPRR